MDEQMIADMRDAIDRNVTWQTGEVFKGNRQCVNYLEVAVAAHSVIAGKVAELPIAMLLYCPQCGQQHIDEPDERTPEWTNPPHRSHLCHDCGCVWRPADVPTNGVASIQTQGKADSWSADYGNAERAALAPYPERRHD